MPKTGVTAAIAEMFEDNERLKRADELLRLELSRKFPRRYYLANISNLRCLYRKGHFTGGVSSNSNL